MLIVWFDKFTSIPKALRIAGPKMEMGIESSQEAVELAGMYEDYTFSENPVLRGLLFGSLRNMHDIGEFWFFSY